ncbi:hypothetical protein MO973_24300 [Paenibacillus sp. TRM 82003]|nr:hypothetical protein [Paenibacillus sp. TRM 82003]
MKMRQAHGEKLERYVVECGDALERRGRGFGLTSAAIWFLGAVWGPVFEFDFRFLRPGFPLMGEQELDYADYFLYIRPGGAPIVFEIFSHRTAGRRLTALEYEAFAERSGALAAHGFLAVRITDIELEYAMKHVKARVTCALGVDKERYQAV